MSKKLVLNEYEICLKMLEMAILEDSIFQKNFWGSMTPDPHRKLTLLVLKVPPPPLFKILDLSLVVVVFRNKNAI